MPQPAILTLLESSAPYSHEFDGTLSKIGLSFTIPKRVVAIEDSVELNVTIHSTPPGAKLRRIYCELRNEFTYGTFPVAILPKPIKNLNIWFGSISVTTASEIERTVFLNVDPETALQSIESPFSVKAKLLIEVYLDDSKIPNIHTSVPILLVPRLRVHHEPTIEDEPVSPPPTPRLKAISMFSNNPPPIPQLQPRTEQVDSHFDVTQSPQTKPINEHFPSDFDVMASPPVFSRRVAAIQEKLPELGPVTPLMHPSFSESTTSQLPISQRHAHDRHSQLSEYDSLTDEPTLVTRPTQPEEFPLPSGYEFHVMISYNWGHKALVKQIHADLISHGLKVWIDEEQMSGNTISAMLQGVTKSCVFLCHMSKSYETSRNCRNELQEAVDQNKQCIQVRLDQGPYPEIKFLLGGNGPLYFDISNGFSDSVMEALRKEVLARLRTIQ